MKKKVQETRPNSNLRLKKTLLYTLAITLGLSSTSFMNKSLNVNALESENYEDYYEPMNSSVLNTLYREQSSYLTKVIRELKEFYTVKDINNIIKNAFSEAYQVIDYQIPVALTEEEYLTALKENNQAINNLKIKPIGNGRDPEYGIIKDDTQELGFRIKTEEDNALIDEYTNILGNPFTIDNSLLNVLSKDKEQVSEEELLDALESLLDKQVNYIRDVQEKLVDFYETKDTKNIIKSAYPMAYNSAIYSYDWESFVLFNGTNYNVVRDTSKSNSELINEYLDIIETYNRLISSLKIKPIGNGRDPEYGIIKDDTQKLGFRRKTEEDKALIDEYTNILGNLVTIPDNVCIYLKSINNSLTKSKVKAYEN